MPSLKLCKIKDQAPDQGAPFPTDPTGRTHPPHIVQEQRLTAGQGGAVNIPHRDEELQACPGLGHDREDRP
jgi:hypothetical protein